MGLLSRIKKFLGGTKSRRERVPKFSRQQNRALDQMRKWGLQNIDPQAIEDRYTKQFEESTVPGLAEMFTGMGGGAQRSSAFGHAVGRAGSDLQSQLAALRSGRGQQMAQFGSQPRFDTLNIPGQKGLLSSENIAKALAVIVPAILSGGATLPLNAAALAATSGGGEEKDQQASNVSNQSMPYNPMYVPGQPQGYLGQGHGFNQSLNSILLGM